MKILAKDSEQNWASYMPLAYFGFFWLQPIAEGATRKGWLLTAFGTVLFVLLYFTALSVKSRFWQLLDLGVMVLLGVLYAPYNGGASCFFIFAAALLPYVVETNFAVIAGI